MSSWYVAFRRTLLVKWSKDNNATDMQCNVGRIVYKRLSSRHWPFIVRPRTGASPYLHCPQVEVEARPDRSRRATADDIFISETESVELLYIMASLASVAFFGLRNAPRMWWDCLPAARTCAQTDDFSAPNTTDFSNTRCPMQKKDLCSVPPKLQLKLAARSHRTGCPVENKTDVIQFSEILPFWEG